MGHRYFAVLILLQTIAGCGPSAEEQQRNAFMSLKPGMTVEEVKALLGTPDAGDDKPLIEAMMSGASITTEHPPAFTAPGSSSKKETDSERPARVAYVSSKTGRRIIISLEFNDKKLTGAARLTVNPK